MKIGVDASCWINSRGYGRFTRELLKAMIAREPDHQYLFFVDSIAYQQCSFPREVKVYKIPTKQAATEAASSSGFRSPVDMFRMAQTVSSEKLDILFYPSVYTYFPTFSNAKKIVAIHDVIPEVYPEMIFPDFRARLFWKIKAWLAVHQADIILTMSNFSKEGIQRHLHVKPEKIVVTTEAADPLFRPITQRAAINKMKNQIGLSEEDRYFLYVGGIGPHKNLRTLISSFNKFKEADQMQHYRLIIVGDYKDDVFWMDSEIQHQAQLDPRKSDILFTGYVPDKSLPVLYSAAEALIVPSYIEGFGLPALEAMSCGTAVIGSSTTSLPEIVGDAGLYFHPDKPDELTGYMKQLSANPSLKAKKEEAGLMRASIYTWEEAANIVLTAMKKLLM